MTLRTWTVPLLLALLALCAACTEPLPTPSATAVPSATSRPTITPHAPQPSLPSVLTPATNGTPDNTQATAIQQARADLARRLQILPGAIEVESTVTDLFPVQNLGCPNLEVTPQAGLPAEAPGLQITLSAAGKRYIYRSRLGQVVYCGEE